MNSESIRSIKPGERFGRLTVIGRSKLRPISTSGGILLLCICDCGNEVAVRSGNLRSGNTKSCGCLKIETLIANNKLRKCDRRE